MDDQITENGVLQRGLQDRTGSGTVYTIINYTCWLVLKRDLLEKRYADCNGAQ